MAVPNYVDFRLREWRMSEQPRRFQACVRKVLNELTTEPLLRLKDPKLEVMVVPDLPSPLDDSGSWAYFPILGCRVIRCEGEQDVYYWRRWSLMRILRLQGLRPKSQTRVLLVFCLSRFDKQSARLFGAHLKGSLGHVLLYLRAPAVRNECADADREWRKSVLATR